MDAHCRNATVVPTYADVAALPAATTVSVPTPGDHASVASNTTPLRVLLDPSVTTVAIEDTSPGFAEGDNRTSNAATLPRNAQASVQLRATNGRPTDLLFAVHPLLLTMLTCL
ncbi:hypothetical protein HPB52_016809 [Rhipicephalus sanguineus]|uniref:Uncharacterized protein n=1 Tax=Rhipicephalus sanguineus TaxID=34632 RepID=A0A9D4PNU9_RHISA|nr:hypothetical protein HPB52_016809 [Rhipicephalus sanguineus]